MNIDPAGMQGFRSNYLHYLSNPSTMDRNLKVTFYMSAAVATTAAAGAGLIVVAGAATGSTVVAGGVTLAQEYALGRKSVLPAGANPIIPGLTQAEIESIRIIQANSFNRFRGKEADREHDGRSYGLYECC